MTPFLINVFCVSSSIPISDSISDVFSPICGALLKEILSSPLILKGLFIVRSSEKDSCSRGTKVSVSKNCGSCS